MKGNQLVAAIPCRLCGNESIEKFHLCGLSKIEVAYFECMNCGSLQTQEPNWLDEAYAKSNLSDLDVGAAQRVVVNQAFVLLFAKLFKLRLILDFGGGDGLLCRLLRDRGLDAYTADEFGIAAYARPFGGSLTRCYDLVTAFEVFEHFRDPSVSLARLFDSRPRFIVASTEVYSGQGSNWWYLAPQSGQHVFFYSRKALHLLAKTHEYSYYGLSGRHVFAREPLSRFRQRTTSFLTSGKAFQMFRATLPFTETWNWILRDYDNETRPHSP
jgi:hypothetical protein